MEFPHRVRGKVDSASLIGKVREHGAVLIRDGGVGGVDDFSRLARELGDTSVDMSCSAGPRVDLGNDVFTSNEAPPEESIPVHHEMAQCKEFPSYVLFFCETPAEKGGSTPVVRSSEVCDEFRERYPSLYSRLKEEGARYLREYPPFTTSTPLGKSWRDAFSATTREEAERKLEEEEVEWEWTEDDTLRVMGPVIRIFRFYGGKETMFMAAETSFVREDVRGKKMLVHADKSWMGEEEKRALLDIGKFAFRASSRVPWEKNDVLILDNRAVMHSRDSFEGKRRVLVTLVK